MISLNVMVYVIFNSEVFIGHSLLYSQIQNGQKEVNQFEIEYCTYGCTIWYTYSCNSLKC